MCTLKILGGVGNFSGLRIILVIWTNQIKGSHFIIVGVSLTIIFGLFLVFVRVFLGPFFANVIHKPLDVTFQSNGLQLQSLSGGHSFGKKDLFPKGFSGHE